MEELENINFQLVSSTTIPYSFTLRKVSNAKLSTQEDYYAKIQKFKDKGIKVTDHVFESNHANTGIHMHGIMQVPKYFNMKLLRSRGWHIYLEEIYDYAGWLCYLTKEAALVQNEVNSRAVDSPKDPDFIMPKVKLF